ncbi:hypothetical protein DSO57_1011304 [Entomophthora muscae]|uniref:Uncharacterized protein n=2 Tax=Entomophthora muscae TaxID=34485 RepID=A0ACC2SJ81_9FUNG|nr:hypothetical protein DSO57_1011303 [Entomophthora muscae]KAJ9062396.1 hypothetical protein DSO57_1011304 [Entomophthora muscae]
MKFILIATTAIVSVLGVPQSYLRGIQRMNYREQLAKEKAAEQAYLAQAKNSGGAYGQGISSNGGYGQNTGSTGNSGY